MGFWSKGMQEISTLIPVETCEVFILMISSTTVSLTFATPSWWWDNAYTNSNHTKHFFLFAVKQHDSNHSLTTRPCNITGLVFTAVVQRLVWSFSIRLQHPNRATKNSHMQWISLFVYWRIMPVNFLPGSHVSVHLRVTLAHMVTATGLVEPCCLHLSCFLTG